LVALGQLLIEFSTAPISPAKGIVMSPVLQLRSRSTLGNLAELGSALVIALAGCAAPPIDCRQPSAAQTPPPIPVASGHTPVNGISMYYEIHGSVPGTPLVLLHGGGSSIAVTYGRILPYLARQRTVIGIDEQGHGKTSDRDAPVRFDTSADDVAALLGALHIEQADVMGFSNGAEVALRLTLRHPALVRKLIFASSITKKSGAAPEFWGFMARASFADMPQPLKDAFLRDNPDPRKLRNMHDKDLERMQHFVETSDDEVRSVKAPTLVLQGDHDVPTLEHGLELSRLFPNARLMVLPGGHGDYLGELIADKPGSEYVALSAGLIDEFLDDRL
jgi:pimeloyl-ACP methyl ester carboxylesterase